jgi:hypothetical protein
MIVGIKCDRTRRAIRKGRAAFWPQATPRSLRSRLAKVSFAAAPRRVQRAAGRIFVIGGNRGARVAAMQVSGNSHDVYLKFMRGLRPGKIYQI